MWIEPICCKDIAEQQLKSYESNFNWLEEIKTITCECGEQIAEFKLIDEFGNKMNLCPDCLQEIEKEYGEEKTSYEITKL